METLEDPGAGLVIVVDEDKYLPCHKWQGDPVAGLVRAGDLAVNDEICCWNKGDPVRRITAVDTV